jgi:hypothetical protein
MISIPTVEVGRISSKATLLTGRPYGLIWIKNAFSSTPIPESMIL